MHARYHSAYSRWQYRSGLLVYYSTGSARPPAVVTNSQTNFVGQRKFFAFLLQKVAFHAYATALLSLAKQDVSHAASTVRLRVNQQDMQVQGPLSNNEGDFS